MDLGQTLTVSVAAARVRSLTLMLISPDGTILDLTDYLQRVGNRWSVSLRAALPGPQVLVAIDTTRPIPTDLRIAAQRQRDIFAVISEDELGRDLDPRASVALILVQ